MKYKQVIVMRTDLNMRKGKMCAQAGHAVLGAVKMALADGGRNLFAWEEESGQSKICVGVDSLEALLNIYNKGLESGFMVYLVTDAGYTEFHNEPTVTCLAFEPLPSDEIDKITGDLVLL